MKQWPPNDWNDVTWKVEDWAYFAEGGANVILRYIGLPVWPFVYNGASLVLRLRKHVFDLPTSPTVLHQDEFLNQVIAQLLPHKYLPQLQRVCIGSLKFQHEFLQQLAQRCEKARPTKRRVLGTIDVKAPWVWVMPDWSRSPTTRVVVEFKPKCGFLPRGPTKYPCKLQYSRYKIHRVYKLLHGKASAPDTGAGSLQDFPNWYDPLDLFSGETIRIERAAHALCKEWANGTGHLRVYIDGVRRKADDECVKEALGSQSDFVNTLAQNLTSCLLSPASQALLTALVEQQQRLDPLNIECLADMWEKYTGVSLDSRRTNTLSEPTLEDYKSAAIRPIPTHLETTDNWQHILRAYMLSATLNDASCFFALGPHESLTARLVDLDVKPIKKLLQYLRHDHQAALTFIHWLSK